MNRVLVLALGLGAALLASGPAAKPMLIDDFNHPGGVSRLGSPWRFVTDRVMGGMSSGQQSFMEIQGRRCLCLHGEVRLENNGGFIQLALDLAPEEALDASRFQGIHMVVLGNGSSYNLHLKTSDVRRPWQSYRSNFPTAPEWRKIRLPFSTFEPHRMDVPLDLRKLRQLGILAIGSRMTAEVCIAEIGFY
jgi:hypothetical protein